ncbi:uncharacterized protein [Macrobrachium rosenbergii]|uniref:uncharacterized protein isoform X1 n=1 Tax=Macrobrachium rosenbergii TaxID=79674 RepID=UPI0034D3F828
MRKTSVQERGGSLAALDDSDPVSGAHLAVYIKQVRPQQTTSLTQSTTDMKLIILASLAVLSLAAPRPDKRPEAPAPSYGAPSQRSFDHSAEVPAILRDERQMSDDASATTSPSRLRTNPTRGIRFRHRRRKR